MTIPGDITLTVLSDLNGPSPQFTLTCISTGGPATIVTWTRDYTTVTEGTDTVLDDPVTEQYTHTLTETGRVGGHYTCTVSNTKPSSASATIVVRGSSTHIPHCRYQKLPITSTVPSAPILTVTVTSTTVTVTGSVPRSMAETGFVVEWQRDTSVGCPDVIQDTMSVTGPFTSYTITGLQPANSYLITVRVYNPLGSAPASTVSAMTEEAGERQKEREREAERERFVEGLTEAVCLCVCEGGRDNYLTTVPPQLPLAIRGQ